MPNKKAAKKELRKGKTNAKRNSAVKANIKTLSKKSHKALAAGQADSAAFIAQTMKALDKAAGKGIIKKNTASRTKSRLQKKLNQLGKK
jgi:small subunit ribosomal protein S20